MAREFGFGICWTFKMKSHKIMHSNDCHMHVRRSKPAKTKFRVCFRIWDNFSIKFTVFCSILNFICHMTSQCENEEIAYVQTVCLILNVGLAFDSDCLCKNIFDRLVWKAAVGTFSKDSVVLISFHISFVCRCTSKSIHRYTSTPGKCFIYIKLVGNTWVNIL